MKRLPIGVDDFKQVVENYLYIDKTLFIKELLENHSAVTLITRPRRFGKTINMSMLDYFFSIEQKDTSPLFQNLAIAHIDNGKYLAERHQYPVIFLTLKDVQNDTWDMMLESFKLLISAEYQKHAYLLKTNCLESYEKDFFNRIIRASLKTSIFQVALNSL